MKIMPFLSLISIILLNSCNYYSDSFHKEFYDGTDKSYETFGYDHSYFYSDGNMFVENDWSTYLNSYFKKDNLKTLSYKNREGYVAIYFKSIESDKNITSISNLLSKNYSNRGLNHIYDLVTFTNYCYKDLKNDDGYSRLIFKDFSELNESVYDCDHHLAAIISYVDVFEGDRKLYTTYTHYALDTFKTLDFVTYELNGDLAPELRSNRTYSFFPNEGNFLNFVPGNSKGGNLFESKYLNTFFKFGLSNQTTLSSFRLEIIDDNYLLIPKYAVEENHNSWGEYIKVFASEDINIVSKEHHTGSIEYYKVSVDELKDIFNEYYLN